MRKSTPAKTTGAQENVLGLIGKPAGKERMTRMKPPNSVDAIETGRIHLRSVHCTRPSVSSAPGPAITSTATGIR